nr:MAG: hypothetical protein [Chemarfal virus 1]
MFRRLFSSSGAKIGSRDMRQPLISSKQAKKGEKRLTSDPIEYSNEESVIEFFIDGTLFIEGRKPMSAQEKFCIALTIAAQIMNCRKHPLVWGLATAISGSIMGGTQKSVYNPDLRTFRTSNIYKVNKLEGTVIGHQDTRQEYTVDVSDRVENLYLRFSGTVILRPSLLGLNNNRKRVKLVHVSKSSCDGEAAILCLQNWHEKNKPLKPSHHL